MDKIYRQMLEFLSEEQIYLNEPMCKHTSFKIGGPADIFVKPKNIDELKNIVKLAKENNIQLAVIGNGSNLLVKDGGIRGIVIKPDFKEIEFLEDDKVKVGAGVLLSKIANEACNRGLSGLEFAGGIPGCIGGAIRMNAGAYGSEFKDIVIASEYLDKYLKLNEISNEEHEFKYRHSRFCENKNEIIASATLQLKKGSKQEIKAKMEENNKSRKEKQPINFPNAGSTFKRGEGYITAQLIDKCNLKGCNVGDAYVSDMHAGFIVNKGNATARDVLTLVEIIKKKVHEEFDVDIELEIEVLGED
ncbi:MAG: UDP-N-acetylmuramate dehydrogenase [Clostridia bacterium]|nr:UDP-N-acetylmuramate dehydrogenase [Clostridia bacterium]